MARFLVFLFVVGCAWHPEPPPPPACATPLTGVPNTPGLSAAIIAHGEVQCVATAGFANLETQAPVAPDTIFAWASVSKTVTGAALVQLVDQGRIALDDPIDAQLPFAVRNPNCPSTPITFRHLLTHSSSIIDDLPSYDASYSVGGDSPIALGDFLATYLQSPKAWSTQCPGTVNSYSNVGFGLVGYLVERVTGTAFDRAARDQLFAPLGMADTSFRLADLPIARVAMPYDGTTAHFAAHGHNGFPTYPDGLLRASPSELSKFLAMFADDGEYAGARVLTAASAREMQRVQDDALDDTQGLVWYYDDYGGNQLLGHEGDDPGTSSLMFFDPDDGTGALLVGNGYWYDDDEDSHEADALFAKLMVEARSY